MAERFNCAICLSFSSETKSDYFVSTRGGHIFHNSCIRKVIDRDVYPVCPVCREPVSEASLTKLYGIDCPERKDGSSTYRRPNSQVDHIFKVVVLGDSGVGKSAVLRRFADDQFHENMVTTVGCDLMFKRVRMGDKDIKLNLWDTAGDEKYRAIIPSYVRNAHAILLVYSMSEATTFDHIEDWIKFANDFGPSDAVRVLIGNKLDQEDLRMIPTRRGKELAEREGLSFFETSAKHSLNIEAALRTATAEILEKPDLVRQADFALSRSRRRLESEEYSAEPPVSLTCC